MPRPAVFLDRDGVINIDSHENGEPGKEILDPEEVKIYDGVVDSLKKLSERGYLLIVVTNQSKVNKGDISDRTLNMINNRVHEMCDFWIDQFYYCPHTDEDNCTCRKPKTGMADRARKEYNIDMNRSWLVGDKTSDIGMGKSVGVKTIMVQTGHGGADGKMEIKPDFVARNLVEATEIILSN